MPSSITIVFILFINLDIYLVYGLFSRAMLDILQGYHLNLSIKIQANANRLLILCICNFLIERVSTVFIIFMTILDWYWVVCLFLCQIIFIIILTSIIACLYCFVLIIITNPLFELWCLSIFASLRAKPILSVLDFNLKVLVSLHFTLIFRASSTIDLF